MSYFRIFAISVCFSFLFLAVFVMVAFDSENTLQLAYDHFSNKHYNLAREQLIQENASIPLADYYLYEGYLTREELGAKKSSTRFSQANHELSQRKSSTALEIALNLALDAYLQKDLEAMKSALDLSLSYTTQDDPWVQFFYGHYAYLKRDYLEALNHWEAAESRKWLSNWMKTGFQNCLSVEEDQIKNLHAKIEAGQPLLVRKKLEMLSNGVTPFLYGNLGDVDFLLALSYMKECEQLSYEERCFATQRAIEHLRAVPKGNSLYLQEKQYFFTSLKKEILEEIDNHHFANLIFSTGILESHHLNEIQNEMIRMVIERVMANHTAAASDLIQAFMEYGPEGDLQFSIGEKLTHQLCEEIRKGNTSHLEDYWQLNQQLLSSSHTDATLRITDALMVRVLGDFEKDPRGMAAMKPYLEIWKLIERNSIRRYSLAQQLVKKAQIIWSVYNQPEIALNLMQEAKQLPFYAEQFMLDADIEQVILKTYHQAALQDHVRDFFYIQQAVELFQLDPSGIFDENDAANQLADAKYLYEVGHFDSAADKATWVVKLFPYDEEARRMAALIAFEKGCYLDVIDHASYVSIPDTILSDAVVISRVLSGYEDSQALYQHTGLSINDCLRLGLGYLLLSKPDDSLYWLQQLPEPDAEVLTGMCIAAFQKHNWEHVVNVYEQLPQEFAKIPAIQGMAVQAWMAQNHVEKADELMTQLLMQTDSFNKEDYSIPFLRLKNKLDLFDSQDFAARYVQVCLKNNLKQIGKSLID